MLLLLLLLHLHLSLLHTGLHLLQHHSMLRVLLRVEARRQLERRHAHLRRELRRHLLLLLIRRRRALLLTLLILLLRWHALSSLEMLLLLLRRTWSGLLLLLLLLLLPRWVRLTLLRLAHALLLHGHEHGLRRLRIVGVHLRVEARRKAALESRTLLRATLTLLHLHTTRHLPLRLSCLLHMLRWRAALHCLTRWRPDLLRLLAHLTTLHRRQSGSLLHQVEIRLLLSMLMGCHSLHLHGGHLRSVLLRLRGVRR